MLINLIIHIKKLQYFIKSDYNHLFSIFDEKKIYIYEYNDLEKKIFIKEQIDIGRYHIYKSLIENKNGNIVIR